MLPVLVSTSKLCGLLFIYIAALWKTLDNKIILIHLGVCKVFCLWLLSDVLLTSSFIVRVDKLKFYATDLPMERLLAKREYFLKWLKTLNRITQIISRVCTSRSKIVLLKKYTSDSTRQTEQKSYETHRYRHNRQCRVYLLMDNGNCEIGFHRWFIKARKTSSCVMFPETCCYNGPATNCCTITNVWLFLLLYQTMITIHLTLI